MNDGGGDDHRINGQWAKDRRHRKEEVAEATITTHAQRNGLFFFGVLVNYNHRLMIKAILAFQTHPPKSSSHFVHSVCINQSIWQLQLEAASIMDMLYYITNSSS